MDLFEAIANRHCYRGEFRLQQVSRDDLRQIVEAGLKAPSGKNCQTTEFVIIDSEDLIGAIRSMHPTNKAMQQAAAYIVCVVNAEPQEVYEGYSFEVEDCAAAVENMLLAITALGYASVWVDGWLRVEGRAEKIGQLIGLPRDKVVRIILPIGVPTEPCTGPKKKGFEERAWYNQYRS